MSTRGGSITIARAMATRCCWPPESCPGNFCGLSLQLHQRQRPIDALPDLVRGKPAHQEAEAHVAPNAHVREQRIVLEHHPEAARLGRQKVDPAVVQPDAAAETGSNPAMQFSAVDLPQPDGPSRAMNSPRRTTSDSSFKAAKCPLSAVSNWRGDPDQTQLTEIGRGAYRRVRLLPLQAP